MNNTIVLLRLYTERRITPREAPQLQRIASRILPRSTLRVVRGHIEIIAFTRPSETQLEMLRRGLGATSIEVLEREAIEWSSECLATLYTRLLEENRFWEAHLVGEEMWRKRIPLGRYLAILAGAYAKAQEGLLGPAKTILLKALEDRELRGLVNTECLEKELERVYYEGVGDISKCIRVEKLVSLTCTNRV